MTRPLVLIVEDHPYMRETLVKILQWEPVDTLTAENGVEALALMHKKPPDLVILDVGLPGEMSGIDVLSAVRSDPKLASIPVILHTSEHGAASLPEAESADLVLLKPADPDDLIVLVHRLLGQAPAETG